MTERFILQQEKESKKLKKNGPDEYEMLPVLLKAEEVKPNGVLTIHFSE